MAKREEPARAWRPAAVGLRRVDGDRPEARLTTLLAARVRQTDIDLFDPAEGQRLGWIGGVHYAEGIDAAWIRAVLRQGVALVVTGPRLIDGGYVGHKQPVRPPVQELRAALVPGAVAVCNQLCLYW